MRHLQSLLACALLALAALACAWPALDTGPLLRAAGITTAQTPPSAAPATVSGRALPEGWTAMPAGARSTYLGIHGGTVPVSLLVSRDGMSLVSFVGQTGNDFLELLRRADVRLPSLLSSVLGSSYGGSMLPGRTRPAQHARPLCPGRPSGRHAPGPPGPATLRALGQAPVHRRQHLPAAPPQSGRTDLPPAYRSRYLDPRR